MLSIYFLAFLALGYAGRAPYLGQDMDQLKEETKRSGITAGPHVNRPVTAAQKHDYNRYNQKFTDIAKAYAEGYKAAIKAVQARALIAQRRIQATRVASVNYGQPIPRSTIPAAPSLDTAANVAVNSGMFNMPVPNEMTVNGMEKSGIPHPEPSAPFSSNQDHKVVERSAPFNGMDDPKVEEHTRGFANFPINQISQKARDEITKLNYAARHRNVYFDHPGGVTRQNIAFIQKKHRRRRRSLERSRRSRMPYLGQNLDALGVVRAQINWDSQPNKKTDMPVPSGQTVKSIVNQPSGQQVYDANAASRSGIPQQVNNNKVNQGYGFYQYPQQQRSAVPQYQYQMGTQQQMMYPNPYYAGFIPNQLPVDNFEDDESAGVERTKKSESSEPDVSTLNYAARHRNVYLDSGAGLYEN